MATATATPTTPTPSDVELEALGLVVKHHGRKALADLQVQIDNLNQRAATAASGLRKPNPTASNLTAFARWIYPSLERRRLYEDRMASLEAIADPTAVPTLKDVRQSAADDVKALAESAWGVDVTARFIAELQAQALTTARRDLEAVVKSIATHAHYFAAGHVKTRHDKVVGLFQQDLFLEDVRALVHHKRTLENRIGRLTGDVATAVQARSDATSAAVKAAGGAAAVAKGVIESRKVRKTFYSADPSALDLQRLEASIAQADTHLAALGTTPETATDGYGATKASERADQVEKAKALRAAMEDRQTSAVATLVANAIAGDEPARATLAADAAALPGAFAPGFPEQIAAAQFEGSSLAALVESLIATESNGQPWITNAGPR